MLRSCELKQIPLKFNQILSSVNQILLTQNLETIPKININIQFD